MPSDASTPVQMGLSRLSTLSKGATTRRGLASMAPTRTHTALGISSECLSKEKGSGSFTNGSTTAAGRFHSSRGASSGPIHSETKFMPFGWNPAAAPLQPPKNRTLFEPTINGFAQSIARSGQMGQSMWPTFTMLASPMWTRGTTGIGATVGFTVFELVPPRPPSLLILENYPPLSW